MHQILAVSADFSLLSIRALVLARSGASVKTALPAEAVLLLKSGEFDLVVLCHSVPQREVQSLTAACRACARPVKTLLIESPSAVSGPPVIVDLKFRIEEGPERLVQAVQALLKSIDTEPPAPGPRLVPSVSSRTPAPRNPVLLDEPTRLRPVLKNVSIAFYKARK